MIGRILYWLGLAPQRQEWALFYMYTFSDGPDWGGGWMHVTITIYRGTPSIDLLRKFQDAVTDHVKKTTPDATVACLSGMQRVQ